MAPQRGSALVTAQEIFDRVWRHFVTEGNPRSVHEYGGGSACAYRGPNGARCAVGLLIPDDEYVPSMEGRCVSAALGPTVRGLIAEGHDGLLDALQNAHDCADEESLGACLGRVAAAYNLAAPS